MSIAYSIQRWLEGLLFGVQPLDAPTITIAAAMLVAVALVAAWVRRAGDGGRADGGATPGLNSF